MSSGDIVLILISGLGVVHGLVLALYLWIYSRGLRIANRLLSLLLLILSFRVGKSVFLVFADDIPIKLIFTGLASLMAIGPLYHLFVRSSIHRWDAVHPKEFIQFIPAFLGLLFGLWINESHQESLSIWIFFFIFIFYYLHLLGYLIASYSLINKHKAKLEKEVKYILSLFVYGLVIIWFAYVTNLFEESIPYVVGPILYSIVAYFISFEVIRKGYLDKIGQVKYKTTHASNEQVDEVFERLIHLLDKHQSYKDPNLTMQQLSENLKVSSQLLSMAVNKKSGKNFNHFINVYRVKEAANLFQHPEHEQHTIAAIAFSSGFNSISSFNTAFKKEFNQTPQQYRNGLMK